MRSSRPQDSDRGNDPVAPETNRGRKIRLHRDVRNRQCDFAKGSCREYFELYLRFLTPHVHRSTPSLPSRSSSVPGHMRMKLRKVFWQMDDRVLCDANPPPIVIATGKELGIAVVGYSPLGKGFLTGHIKSRKELPEGDIRLHLDRFSEEVGNSFSDSHPIG